MKAFKLLLLTLFAALGFAAQAQTIKVYKDGQVVDTFSAAQVDSVVYKQVTATPKYYYYVGTVKPTAENLETIGTLTTSTLSSVSFEGFGAVYKYFIYPSTWGIPIFTDPNTGDEIGITDYTEYVAISGYKCYRASKAQQSRLIINWK